MILCCGDLEHDYIEFLVDGIDKDVFFVTGNHEPEINEDDYSGFEVIDRIWDSIKTSAEKLINRIAGQEDMHGRVAIWKGYLIVGFGGSRWYNGRGNQFRESDMASIVRSAIRKVRLFRLKDRILGRRQREVIVISHAPPSGIHDLQDPPHMGFKCFHKFIKKISPALWLHGHVHLSNPRQQQVTVVGNTTVVNCYCYKFIKIERRKIQVSNKYDI